MNNGSILLSGFCSSVRVPRGAHSRGGRMETGLLFSTLRSAFALIALMFVANQQLFAQATDECTEGCLQKIDPSCPTPTFKMGNQWLLREYVDLSVLNKTLEIAPFTHFNCQGHQIFTSHPGTSAQNRSQPEVGILLKSAYGIKIQNCVIQGFDFGIFALKSKIPPEATADPGMLQQLGNDILNNEVRGRSAAVELVEVDNTRIKENHITINRGSAVF